jgi:hypothetical protein
MDKGARFTYTRPQTYYVAVGQFEVVIKPDPAHELILSHQ